MFLCISTRACDVIVMLHMSFLYTSTWLLISLCVKKLATFNP